MEHFLCWSQTLLAGNQFHNTNNVIQSGCSVPLHHVSYNLVPRAFGKIPWEQSCVSRSRIIVTNNDADDDEDEEDDDDDEDEK